MKRYIRSSDTSKKVDYRPIIQRACDFLGVEYPVKVTHKSKNDSYKLTWYIFDDFTLKTIKESYGPFNKFVDALYGGQENWKQLIGTPGFNDKFNKDCQEYISKMYDDLYEFTGIRFTREHGDTYFYPNYSGESIADPDFSEVEQSEIVPGQPFKLTYDEYADYVNDLDQYDYYYDTPEKFGKAVVSKIEEETGSKLTQAQKDYVMYQAELIHY